ncbi:MAG: phosphate ABC transporter permease PstA [Anaerolineales bacterium]
MSQLQNIPENVHPDFDSNISKRHRSGKIWRIIFRISTVVGVIALAALLINVGNSTMGYAAVDYKIQPDELAINDIPLEMLHKDDLTYILRENVSEGLYENLNNEKPFSERSHDDIYNLVIANVAQPKVLGTWKLWNSLTDKNGVFQNAEEKYAEKFPDYEMQFINWFSKEFITNPQSSDPVQAGIRTAILGSLMVIAITIVFSFPVGVGAAIYLEEYATDSAINRLIQTNINNLAGVPSLIYGILGLAIFVRVLEPLTSGAIFGYVEDPTTANGRTILSAGLTLGVLILPMIIINAQEAIRAVPNSLRNASLGVGATKWQTIWSHVLPNALPGILTGVILAMSRAIGETAPLVVVGASTYITYDPDGPFSKFTVLPIQIYQWTARPQDVFRNIAAAAIIVLLILLFTMNATAVLLRNKYSKKF